MGPKTAFSLLLGHHLSLHGWHSSIEAHHSQSPSSISYFDNLRTTETAKNLRRSRFVYICVSPLFCNCSSYRRGITPQEWIPKLLSLASLQNSPFVKQTFKKHPAQNPHTAIFVQVFWQYIHAFVRPIKGFEGYARGTFYHQVEFRYTTRLGPCIQPLHLQPKKALVCHLS